MIDTSIPQVNFYSMLSGLGDQIAAARKQSAINDAMTAAQQPGVSYGDAIRGLVAAGATPQAQLFANLQAHQDALTQQATQNARQDAQDKLNAQHWAASYALQKQNADRLNESPLDKANERAAVLKANNIDPASPQGQSYLLTGTYTAPPIPSGFGKRADGTLAPLPGGPADPTYIGSKEQAIAQAKASAPGGGGLSLNPIYGKDANGNTVLLQMGKNGVAQASKLPDGVTLNGADNETIAADAARLNAGDTSVLKKYSNRGQGRIDLLRLNNEANQQREAQGLDPIDITQNQISMQGDLSREKASGTMEGRMAPASIEAQGAFKIAQNAADNLWRTNNVPLNRVLQMGEAAMSDPNLKAAKVAYNTAVMTYSRAIAPTGVGTVDAQAHAREILDSADGPAATQAAFAQLAREVDMAHASPQIARQYFAEARKARLEGKPPPQMPTYQPAQPPAPIAPPAAIQALKQDPRRAADFDAYYGAGSAQRVLSGGSQ